VSARPQGGFTLVELLVASAILVVLGVAGYAGLEVVLDSAKHTAAQTERLDKLQRCFTQMAMDFEQFVPRPVRDELGDDQAALIFATGLNTLEFTRTGVPNPAAWARSSLQRVGYALDQGRLWRSYWPTLDRVQGATPVRRLMLDGVRSMAFRFLDSQREWHEQWPPLSGGTLGTSATPLAVELRLELDNWGEVRRVYALPG